MRSAGPVFGIRSSPIISYPTKQKWYVINLCATHLLSCIEFHTHRCLNHIRQKDSILIKHVYFLYLYSYWFIRNIIWDTCQSILCHSNLNFLTVQNSWNKFMSNIKGRHGHKLILFDGTQKDWGWGIGWTIANVSIVNRIREPYRAIFFLEHPTRRQVYALHCPRSLFSVLHFVLQFWEVVSIDIDARIMPKHKPTEELSEAKLGSRPEDKIPKQASWHNKRQNNDKEIERQPRCIL